MLVLAIGITALAVGFGQAGSEARSPNAANTPRNPVLVELSSGRHSPRGFRAPSTRP